MELTWSRAASIGDPRVCLTVYSQGAAGVANRVLFCLPDLSDTFPPDILVSLSLGLARTNRGEAGIIQGRHGAEGCGAASIK